jgi:hypothetical protein
LTNGVEAARNQVLDIVHDLDAIKFRLLGVQASLPPGIVELDRFLEMEATDPAAILRAAISCVLQDHLGPMVRDLEAAVAAASSDGRADDPGQGEA